MLRTTLILLSLLLFALGAQAQDAPTATPQQGTITYTIQWNDSLGAIAARYRTSVAAIMRLNNLSSSEMIVAGRTLLIPVPATPHPAAETPTEVPPVVDVPAATTEPTPEVTLPLTNPTASLPAFDYGVEAYFDNQDASTVVQQVTAIGMHWAKVRVSWRALEPTQGSIDFTPLDGIVDVLSANNLHVLLTLSNAPDWSRSSPVESGPPDNFDDFAAFSSAVAARYAGRVQAYEIWHEPNLRREWNNPLYPVSPQHYAELLRRAYVAIKLADENAIVLSAGLAPTGFNDSINAIDDRIFLDQLYEQGLAGISDAIGAHPFGFANPPDALCCQASPGVLTHFEHPSFYFANTLQDYRNIMLANDDPLTNIWVTEFGWGTSEDMSAPTEGNSFIGDNTRAEQAQYISRAFELGAGLGYVRIMIAYNLNSCIAQPGNTDACYYSLLDSNGQPRAAYNTLGMMFLPALES